MSKYYYLIERSNLTRNSYVADKWDLRTLTTKVFERGICLHKYPKCIYMISSGTLTDGNLDDFIVNDAMIPAITQRLADCIKSIRTPTIQMLRAKALYSNGMKIECYILNFTRHIPGLDMERTKVERYAKNFPDKHLRNRIAALYKPVLKLLNVQSYDLFRVQEYPGRLFCSSRFRNLFLGNKMTGVSFADCDLS